MFPENGFMSLKIIHSGTLIGAKGVVKADLLIDGEKIAATGHDFKVPGAEVIDASGKLVMPGGVDPHTHFDLPMFNTVSSDDHYTGHKAAAFGGTTTVLDFIPFDYPTLVESVDAWHFNADEKAAIDFGFHMNITKLNNQILTEIPKLIDEGITSLKVFTAYNKRLRLQDGEILKVMRCGSNHGLLTMLHGENGDVIELLTEEALEKGYTEPIWHARTRPATGATESIITGIALAEQAGSPLYVVHVNTFGGKDQINYGRTRGLPVMGETCPQYLFFTEDHLLRPDGAKWVCSPPVRTAKDNEALWGGLADGTLQVFSTDHCPFFYDGTREIEYEGELIAIPGKELGADDFTKIPNGLPGVGDRMPILWTFGVGEGRISPNQFVALTSTNPAKIFGLYPRKGALLPGSDADIVIWDPTRPIKYGLAHSHHRTDYNLYEGWDLMGFPEKVLLRGQVIVDGEKWLGKRGMGRFQRREPGAEEI
jgi:dihydropyrimidinase